MDKSTPQPQLNPAYQELVELLQQASAKAELVARALQRPAVLMSQDRVWTGAATADVFAAELEGRRADLPRRFEEFVDAVAARRNAVPRTVDGSVWEL